MKRIHESSRASLELLAGIMTVEATDRMLQSGQFAWSVGKLVLANFNGLSQTISETNAYISDSTQATIDSLKDRIESSDGIDPSENLGLVAEASFVFASTLNDLSPRDLSRINNEVLDYGYNGIRALGEANKLQSGNESYFSDRNVNLG